jgi:hypothetical protein
MKAAIALVFIILLRVSSLFASIHYVSLASTNPAPPYLTWSTAAPAIQQAIAFAVPGDQVLVTNGIYREYVQVSNQVTLLSVNGPQFTVVDGGETNGCVYLVEGANLSGFTLRNGRAANGSGVACASTDAFVTNCLILSNSVVCGAAYGGGVYGCTLYNCKLLGNSSSRCASYGNSGGGAAYSALYNCTLCGNWANIGGGAFGCTLYNCAFTGNSATNAGGGAYGCQLYNCTLAGNSSGLYAGGAFNCMLYNCIVYYNTATNGPNYDSETPVYQGSSTLNYCCTIPMPPDMILGVPPGLGNITSPPLFVDFPAGNFRLQSDSPCINSGNNTYVSNTTDLDGQPRVFRGTVDIGAYEFQGSGSLISYAWLQKYALPLDGSQDYSDPDVDRMNNWQEWICGTDPYDFLSFLTMSPPSQSQSGLTLQWSSVAERSYFLLRSTNIGSPFSLLVTNIPGLPGSTSYTDTNASGIGRFFYRVGVQR